MSNVITFGKTVSLKQAASLILASPENRYLLGGEPGIGKSSIMAMLKAMLPNHETAYIDCASLDLGDIAMPWIDKETGTTRYAPNNRFKFHTGKPVIVMLDEFSKAVPPVQNMLHPLLEAHNPRLGDVPVHPDSIIFLTGNLSTDGVGDNLKAHTKNRLIRLNVRKASSDEWLEWAGNNQIDSAVMAFVHQYPHCMASYQEEGQDNNLYIFQPRKVQDAFVSGRSLERASNVIKRRAKLDTDTLLAALIGTVGESAARDMQAFVEYQDQLPTWESIMDNPKEAKLPTGAGACSVMVFGAIQRVDKQNIAKFMEYLNRFESEWQACFAIHIARNPQKQAVAFSSKAFATWLQNNEDIL